MANFALLSRGRAARRAAKRCARTGLAAPARRSWCTPRRRPTPGSRRPPTSSATGPRACARFPSDADLTIDVDALVAQLEADRRAGARPFLLVGNAGTVSTGAIDPLARAGRDLPAPTTSGSTSTGPTVLWRSRATEAPPELQGLRAADSVAVDPHKWLYAPLEAGCALVRHAGRPARRLLRTRRRTTASTARSRTRAPTTSSWGCRTRAASARSRSGSACGRRAATATGR